MKKGAKVNERVLFKRNIKKRRKRANKSQAPKYRWIEAKKPDVKVVSKTRWYRRVWEWVKKKISHLSPKVLKEILND